MMKRNCRFEVRLTKDELSDLTRKARKARITNAAYVRHAIRDTEVREAPNVDVPVLIREVKRVGYNINQILKIANVQGLVNVLQLRKALDENHTAVQTIIRAYTDSED